MRLTLMFPATHRGAGTIRCHLTAPAGPRLTVGAWRMLPGGDRIAYRLYARPGRPCDSDIRGELDGGVAQLRAHLEAQLRDHLPWDLAETMDAATGQLPSQLLLFARDGQAPELEPAPSSP